MIPTRAWCPHPNDLLYAPPTTEGASLTEEVKEKLNGQKLRMLRIQYFHLPDAENVIDLKKIAQRISIEENAGY